VVVDHGFDLGSVSALSEMNSKSACTFPVISNAVLVRSSSVSSRLFCLRSRSSSTCSTVRLPDRPFDVSPASAPESRCFRHSEMCEE